MNFLINKDQSRDIDDTVENLEEANGGEAYNKIEQNQEQYVCCEWDNECWLRCYYAAAPWKKWVARQ